MNGCRELMELIHRRLDGELAAEERDRLDTHLEICPACRASFEELGELQRWIVEVGATDRVESLQGLRSPPVPLSHRRPSGWKLAAPIAASLLLGLGLLLASLAGPPRRATPTPRGPVVTWSDASTDLLVVQLETRHERLHVIWFYPTNPKKGDTP